MTAVCRRVSQQGFTFIELMMTLAIMGVLAMLAVPTAQVAVKRQQEYELRAALIQIREAIDAYKRAAEQGRIMMKIGDSGYPPSLNVLVDGVVDQRSPTRQRLYFLRRLPADPFNAGQAIRPAESWGVRSYASPPDAPSEGRDVFDVYSKSGGTGLNGVPYRAW
ncbi:type II secretion system major pseudopilin GspG [Pseudoduganella ginsengisoli]|uniref:Prepilin-type N-terminal cleavage/methylation domain-containing protein n=1 Tax=Pseudoduganella ginsengisoli TaxID=1462440 RepID=A0A6L6Q076_9BURK|nr:type II secretion system protein [Pseudoduganella ginsengisoli]MTW02432.1 prepilin-type N-terminal cleavage/methylation domain-containing protein [Pseudoduganella ginsengisoli]